MPSLAERLEELLDAPVRELRPLHGGMVADVRLVVLANGDRLVAKSSGGTPLSVEAAMLQYLAHETALPVPAVIHASDDLLLLQYVEGSSQMDDRAEEHAADLLASLHSIGAARFGFEFDTLIGPLPQSNRWTDSWPEFFREQRLLPLIEECRRRGRIDSSLERRLVALAERFDEILGHSPAPGLVHGDVWSGNVLARDGAIAALLDPALYFADVEVELAFIDMFGTFGGAFWERYRGLREVSPDYARYRRDVYQLYPLLVHVALFGGSYVDGVKDRLRRLDA